MSWKNIFLHCPYQEIYKQSCLKDLIPVLTVLYLFLVARSPLAQARLGAGINTFTDKLSSSFRLIGKEKKDGKLYYHYSVITDSKVNNASPGFGGGLTVTVENGKISGESLVVKFGNDREIGQRLTSILCLNLAYEALAKTIPKSTKDQNAELEAYKQAVYDASLAKPGRIGYPGFSTQLIFSMTKDGSFLFVISPQQTIGQKH